MSIALLAVGIVVICVLLAVVCDRHFVPSLDRIAHKLRLPHDVAGATLMAAGSSAPELFTALIAVVRSGAEDVGPGTIVGSAIFNILVIVGASAFVARAVLDWKPVLRDMMFYLLSIALLLWTFIDGVITLTESLLFVLAYVVYIAFLWMWSRYFPASQPLEESEQGEVTPSTDARPFLLRLPHRIVDATMPNVQKNPHLVTWSFALSLVWISMLSWLLVESAVLLSEALHIPAVIIGLTVLAAGTSVPDLLSSIIVAKEGRGDMAVSNAVGSNTFDILMGLGLPWLLYIGFSRTVVSVNTANLASSVILLFCTVAALLFLLAMRRFHLGRFSGLVLLVLYVCYVCYAAYGAMNPSAFEWNPF